MAIRIEGTDLPTAQLFEQILVGIVQKGERVAVTVPSGSGLKCVARIRVALTRKRKELKRKKRKLAFWTLRTTVHPETHDGRRFDCVVFWREVSTANMLNETLEDLLSHD